MEPDDREAAGYQGPSDGYAAQHRGVTTENPIPGLVIVPDNVSSDGLVCDGHGEPLTTPTDKTHIFAVGPCGRIHIAFEHERKRSVAGAVKHDTLLRGAPAWGAGEIRFRAGVVVEINTQSGTYRPDRRIETFVRNLLKRSGVKQEGYGTQG